MVRSPRRETVRPFPCPNVPSACFQSPSAALSAGNPTFRGERILFSPVVGWRRSAGRGGEATEGETGEGGLEHGGSAAFSLFVTLGLGAEENPLWKTIKSQEGGGEQPERASPAERSRSGQPRSPAVAVVPGEPWAVPGNRDCAGTPAGLGSAGSRPDRRRRDLGR